MPISDFPRAMSDAERAMLDFMLAVDDARVEPFRKQADHATVVSLCGCGCATINLVVDRDAAPVAPGLPYAVVDASRRRPFPDDDFYEMTLFRPRWVAQQPGGCVVPRTNLGPSEPSHIDRADHDRPTRLRVTLPTLTE
jgi:hypothetical protein